MARAAQGSALIALDTSSFSAFLLGEKGHDVDAVEVALMQRQAILPPAVLSELLSNTKLPGDAPSLFKEIPLLPLGERYWEKAGLLRLRLLVHGFKAPLADSLIAQSCLDHHVPLITRDLDFKHFARICGLKLTTP